MDITQAVLFSVILVITLFLVVVGFQVFFLLRDLQKTIKKTDRIINKVDETLNSQFLTGIFMGAAISNIVGNKDMRIQSFKDIAKILGSFDQKEEEKTKEKTSKIREDEEEVTHLSNEETDDGIKLETEPAPIEKLQKHRRFFFRRHAN